MRIVRKFNRAKTDLPQEQFAIRKEITKRMPVQLGKITFIGGETACSTIEIVPLKVTRSPSKQKSCGSFSVIFAFLQGNKNQRELIVGLPTPQKKILKKVGNIFIFAARAFSPNDFTASKYSPLLLS